MSDRGSILDAAVEIVASYVAGNQLEPDGVPDLLRSVHATLTELSEEPESKPAPVPAVPIEESLSEDALICLEDGQSFRSLKRHLRTEHDLTPEGYREKWGLPADYPMVAPGYARERSRLAKRSGLGKA